MEKECQSCKARKKKLKKLELKCFWKKECESNKEGKSKSNRVHLVCTNFEAILGFLVQFLLEGLLLLCQTSLKWQRPGAIVYLQFLLPYRKMLINFTIVWNDYKMFHVNSVGKFDCMILKLYLKVVDYFSQFTFIWTRQLCNVVPGGSLPNDISFWKHSWMACIKKRWWKLH